jgi:glycosyltransferase A (GT-A) superfamily protein (DUF2064 family)
MKTLIIFAKLPLEGRVKTRLTATTDLTDAQTLALYEAFLNDTLTMATLTSAETLAIHYLGDGVDREKEDKQIKRIVRRLALGARNERRFTFRPQEGETFTDRIKNAFAAEAVAGAEEVAMIGADSPTLQPETIDAAFDFIYARSGFALGPTAEGGVYFIGYPAAAPILFDEVFTHGSELVNLVGEAKKMGAPLKILPEILDVDVAADLATLVALMAALDYQRSFETNATPIHTMKAVAQLGLTVERNGDDSRSKKVVAAADLA